jgi:hypothetical protein
MDKLNSMILVKCLTLKWSTGFLEVYVLLNNEIQHKLPETTECYVERDKILNGSCISAVIELKCARSMQNPRELICKVCVL